MSAEEQREFRKRGRTRLAMKVQSIAYNEAIKWVRREHPDVWADIYAAATAEAERRHPELAEPIRPTGPRTLAERREASALHGAGS